MWCVVRLSKNIINIWGGWGRSPKISHSKVSDKMTTFIVSLVQLFTGSTHVLGGGVTIMGMLMMAVAVLLFLFSIRQFLIAKKMRQSEQNLQVHTKNWKA